jgi:hypothetical protein
MRNSPVQILLVGTMLAASAGCSATSFQPATTQAARSSPGSKADTERRQACPWGMYWKTGVECVRIVDSQPEAAGASDRSGVDTERRQGTFVLDAQGSACPWGMYWKTGVGCERVTDSQSRSRAIDQGKVQQEARPIAEDKQTRIQENARKTLDRPGVVTPFPCDDGWLASNAGYVLDLTSWAEAAGLQRGDRLLAFGGVLVSMAGDWGAALSQVTREDPLELRVERAGREQIVRLPCRDNTPWWRAQRDMFEAMRDGKWEACMDATQRLQELARRPYSVILERSDTSVGMRRRRQRNRRRQPGNSLRWSTKR